ncbi:hypothetical protein [Mesoaciditoga lauensis]|uniref:hypothetical protein n=1 Tax=Mesoaciditoga lauensis TaxID=1495039 RepID=UPI00056698E4|nr:hypothetical protein [Mesoaciditoga lauensis]
MKKLLVIAILTLAMSALVFGFGIEIGGGVNMLSLLGLSAPIPTVAAGVVVPIMGPFSLTGQVDALFSFSDNSSMAFIILGGGRYTFDVSNMKIFAGVDGGIMTGFSSTQSGSQMLPIFGVNGGVNFGMFYLKGAMRWLSVTYSYGETSGPTTILLNLTELTGGLYFEF